MAVATPTRPLLVALTQVENREEIVAGDEPILGAKARIRALLAEYDRGERSLAALLAEIKRALEEEADSEAAWRTGVLATLRKVGRSWIHEPEGDRGTLALEDEKSLRRALDELRRDVS